jgi:hypothetical protein
LLTGIGEGQLAGGALQETHAEARFQLGHAARQAGLGDAQGPPGGGESAAVDHLGEVEHVVQVAHCRPMVGTI